MNLKLTIAYDGTHYLGWQKTSTGPSIEAELESALFQILQKKITLQAAGRTDAGVHAEGQVVNFISLVDSLNLDRFKKGVNALLPYDIRVLNIEIASDSFHPTVHCVSKEYRYQLCYSAAQLPQHRFYSWHYPYALDIDVMRQGAVLLQGIHNFKAFCNQKKNERYSDYMREVQSITFEELSPSRLLFIIKGPHFLYKMVRNLVGTLVYLGRGKLTLDQILTLLTGCNRAEAGMTAPAHGLTLYKVVY